MIKNGSAVSLAYKLTNDKGEEIDAATKAEPFAYLHGHANIVAGLESALEGLKIGDKKKVVVKPEDGYGEFDEKLKVVVKRDMFEGVDKIEPGMQFGSKTEDGTIVYTVVEVKKDVVHLDGNHPLAGQTLHFDVEVLEVRAATEEELAHGHIHGPHGHHH
jgi:FKBP-type peptidyl-prolyl cis-trans isomerase SlyD